MLKGAQFKFMKTTIIVKFSLEGLHCWELARDVFPEVGYLSNLHRHLFYFECELAVQHNDRDKEFLLFRREIINYLNNQYFSEEYKMLNFEGMSCESIATELFLRFR